MKKLTIILVLIFAIQLNYSYAWEWEEYGPPGIKANKICFFENTNYYAMISVDSGMYLITDYNGQTWEFQDFHAVEAVSPGYDSDSIITIINEGSYSDGIWSFNQESGQLNILEWCFQPNFIITNNSKDRFYVGYEYGLLYSEDCITWSEVSFFNDKKCIDMEIANNILVVATSDETDNTYLSEDDGLNWNQLAGDNISELSSSYMGIYAIAKGDSYNCGLYTVNVSSMSWYNMFYSYNLNAVGTNNAGEPFIGWYNGYPSDEGIAKYENSGFIFYNDGLPNLNINSIASPGIAGATVIYCCTDSGAYNRVLSVGVQENLEPGNLSIFPNPFTKQTTIKLNHLQNNDNDNIIRIYNSKGLIVDEIRIGTNPETIWDKGGLPSGVYYMAIKTKNGNISKKIIIL